MADSTIGTPLPRGIVDVEHAFVGIQPQQINVKNETARLQKEITALKNRIRSRGLTETLPLQASPSAFTSIVLAVSVTVLLIGALKYRR